MGKVVVNSINNRENTFLIFTENSTNKVKCLYGEKGNYLPMMQRNEFCDFLSDAISNMLKEVLLMFDEDKLSHQKHKKTESLQESCFCIALSYVFITNGVKFLYNVTDNEDGIHQTNKRPDFRFKDDNVILVLEIKSGLKTLKEVEISFQK